MNSQILTDDYRYIMASWTPDHSTILSKMLDEVTGTPEMINIRQDFCKIEDCIKSKNYNVYFTGSKAEGLELPGSDEDFMMDVNKQFDTHIKVIQSLDELPERSIECTLLMSVESVPPGFALLQHINPTLHMIDLELIFSTRKMNGLQYLTSNWMVECLLFHSRFEIGENDCPRRRRQGPSIEVWTDYGSTSDFGTDLVMSIHCPFWPNIALEWTQRPRYFGWPNSREISSITEFGCHLVPVGHPHSEKKLMEWRISFSLAERTLVWSFNHVQMQCYAFMKIILKEFIKVRCSLQNQVLCSYFIKTFLFWKYETKELNFWRADNLRECIRYLLTEFSQCIRKGVLSHYFIPKFNLLSVKLTREAQAELLQLFDIIVQGDISILKECKTLQNIWSEFLGIGENKNDLLPHIKRRNILLNDECMMTNLYLTESFFYNMKKLLHPKDVIRKLLLLSCKTLLKTFLLRRSLFDTQIKSLIQQGSKNRKKHQVYQIAQNCSKNSTDIATFKLWCAILLFMQGEYASTLRITYHTLSSIPPFAMYHNKGIGRGHCVDKQLYVDMVSDSGITEMQRPRKAWLFDLLVGKGMTSLVPLGIQIELYFCDPAVAMRLSPFTCIYYLQFLCYHEMRQYDDRDRALQHLIYTANNVNQNDGEIWPLNLAGHCLLIAGQRTQAQYMFVKSNVAGNMVPLYDKYNSAAWYLRNFF